MIDFSKAYCSLHPHQLVTNFCNKDECLTPLCANCICTHTDGHVEKGTSPDYQNIRTTYKRIQDSLHSQIDLFEDEKQRIVKICGKIEQKRSKLKQIINIARSQLQNFIKNYFQQKEKRMLRQIENQQKKRGLHCENRLQQMNSYISRQITSLISATEDMTSNNFLQSLPRIRTQVLGNSQALYKQVSSELNQNQKFSTTLAYDPSYINMVQSLIQNSIQLLFSSGNLENKNTPLIQKKIVQNVKTDLNKNIQSQITFNKLKNDQYLLSNEKKGIDKKFTIINSQPKTIKKQNNYYSINPFLNTPTPEYKRNSPREANRNEPRSHSQNNLINKNIIIDPKISLIKVSEDHKLKNMSTNKQKTQSNLQNAQIMKVSKIDENGQTMKKSRKSGLRILANNNDQDNNYKMYRTQMI